jgi:endonuclease
VRGQAFREWLTSQFATNTVSTQLSTSRRLENAYGDLDEIFDENRFDPLLSELTYSKSDEIQNIPNPSKLQIEKSIYDTLSGCRTALRTYRNFRDDPASSSIAAENAIEVAGELIRERKEGRLFEIERHLQNSLRTEISQLETGLIITDGGTERGVESGLIDITALDNNDNLVVVELKRGKAGREAIGQILGYMGDLLKEEPQRLVRGILVAADFDQASRSAASFIPQLTLKKYRFQFSFEDPE